MEQITREEAAALRDSQRTDRGWLGPCRAGRRAGPVEAPVPGRRQRGPDHAAPTTIDDLYRAHFEGQVPQVRLRDGVVTVQYKRRWNWSSRDLRSDFTLNARLPWDIEVAGGANRFQARLADDRPPVVRDRRRRQPAPADARAAQGRRPDPAEQQQPRSGSSGPRGRRSGCGSPAASPAWSSIA